MYEKRSYRKMFGNELVMFEVCIGETDLMIGCDCNLEAEALHRVRRARSMIMRHIESHPEFETILEPLETNDAYPDLINSMLSAGISAGTGPMAAVAGMVAEYVGRGLMEKSGQVFVENGGDIFFASDKDRKIGIYAGNSVLSNRIAVRLKKDMFPIGICTSSGTVGHSFSRGRADAVTVLSGNTALADAVATAACNLIKEPDDISGALEFAVGIDGITGAVAIMGDKLGAAGEIELAKVNEQG